MLGMANQEERISYSVVAPARSHACSPCSVTEARSPPALCIISIQIQAHLDCLFPEMPTLPPELEREIFEVAIRDNLSDTALKLNLSLVARRVQYWIDLIQYEMVTITNRVEAHKFFDLVNWKSQDFFAHAVKATCITYYVPADEASRILSVCSNVQQLACWVPWEKSPDLPQLLSRLPLTHLSIEVGHFLNIPRSQSTWFLGLTHLDLIWWSSSPRTTSPNLGELPNLTHVSLSGAGRSEARSVCLNCASLQVLLILTIPRWETEEEYTFDARIVLAAGDFAEDGDVVEIWKHGVWGRPGSIWAYAEDILLERKQKPDCL
ncbi:hypothetical protein MSAN_01864000 [Mycena sanguinolenta]|uniref:Uncharacterized protein n=1 Tax=Mycena sanguinolenta TaxID=230812 RepID=A0A8H7CS85_9AGAR|nr:hypothetical protein MSAN_01864000 [Mycena sanguinolenta]